MPLGFPPANMTAISASFEPVSFAELPGWNEDDQAAAFNAFLASCGPVRAHAASIAGAAIAGAASSVTARLAQICEIAQSKPCSESLSIAGARSFFEAHFTPHRVRHNGAEGLLTAYYEPEIEGSMVPTERFTIPVYRRPPDLINLVSDAARGTVGDALTHVRQTSTGVEPFATREMIERGALKGQDLELLWLEDAVDCFFLHIQGSGLIRLPDGTALRITYDGKNGHPYTSVGRYLIDQGHFTFDQMSLDAMKVWLGADIERGRQAMRQNKSFVFFRVLDGDEAKSAMGVMHIPLSEGRSLAVDTSFHAIGTPVYVSAPTLTHAAGAAGTGFKRLMIAQDVGSAIRGPERGDLYFGSGDQAGALAGVTKHPGSYFVLLPNAHPAAPATP